MKVRVIDWGKIYTTYDEWLTNNDCSEYLKQYKQEEKLYNHLSHNGCRYYPVDKNGKEIDMINITYEVLKQNIHGEHDGRILFLIQEPITNKVYLIDKDGTKEVRS